MPEDKNIGHVNNENFDQVVLKSSKPVLVDFYADWCGPCRMLAPILSEFARENPDTTVVKVNVDAYSELADRYGIQSIPTLLVFKNGQLTTRQNGLASKEELKELVSQEKVVSR